MKKIKCECGETGKLNSMIADWYDQEKELPFVNHKPNECKCVNNLKKYIRNGKKVWLCSCCCLSSDKEITKSETTPSKKAKTNSIHYEKSHEG